MVGVEKQARAQDGCLVTPALSACTTDERVSSRLSSCLAMLSVLFMAPVAAQVPAPPQEQIRPLDPIVSEEASPTEPGELELRTAVDFSEDSVIAPRVQAFFGLLDRVSGEAGVEFADETNEDYRLGEWSVGIKGLAWAGRGPMPAVVLSTEVVGLVGAEADGFEIEPSISIVKGLRRVTMQAAFGVAIPVGSGPDEQAEFIYSAAVVVPASDRIHLVAEVEGVGEDGHRVAPGVRYVISEAIALAGAVPMRIDEPGEYGGLFQLQITFGK